MFYYNNKSSCNKLSYITISISFGIIIISCFSILYINNAKFYFNKSICSIVYQNLEFLKEFFKILEQRYPNYFRIIYKNITTIINFKKLINLEDKLISKEMSQSNFKILF